ncbi:hypothetical protein EMIHUDRAFT_232570 [Emiliania huxleyi CCMP1516]|uniref:EF-hand domain-containing protein n=2 Tax=Emiliania huxleyi TaxID=2903 RepID=A0A0D3K4R4_EMIH1|nr:hypothetical protein EMIHUDRAFT_232570 [Emiliania huxleyi CCMP1516]EOD30749.1 hypothetical protein EMIHUDRAFT_232570 [Emiliania huxleyi CCMP1516]|eukprot:XP_005783178.1 hypothetical protein EMIHUDRAFT_232570 [Emiliania huxleyi CCMP1516]
MASPTAPSFSVPKELPSVLKAFTREVLRANPPDIYGFGAEYFREVVAASKSARANSDTISAQLDRPHEELFETADVDKSGSINVKELSTLMTVAGIGGTASEALYGANILNPIDDEFDGVPTMDCTEFCLFMKEKLGEDAGKVAKQMKDMLALRALFETGIRSQDAFRASDADGDGSLDVAELSKLMAAAGIGGSASDALYDANINDVFSHDFTDVAKMDYTEFLLFMKDKLGDTAGYAAAQMKEMTALKSLETTEGYDST